MREAKRDEGQREKREQSRKARKRSMKDSGKVSGIGELDATQYENRDSGGEEVTD